MNNQGQRLNLKWTVADVDLVIGLARSGRSAAEIIKRVKARGIDATPREIRELCWQRGLKVLMAPRVCS